jgi:hypothetical protein
VTTGKKLRFAPVPWAHHPPDVKSALRVMRLRPMRHMCWRNSQRLFLYSDPALTYVEGWVTLTGVSISIDHGWLLYPGKVLDLTLRRGAASRYEARATPTQEEVIAHMLRTGTWSAVGTWSVDRDPPEVWESLFAGLNCWVRARSAITPLVGRRVRRGISAAVGSGRFEWNGTHHVTLSRV